MEDFKKMFYEEALDLIGKLEETLLLLEEDKDNNEYIDEIFRIMHSLKGSGAMFGFTALSSFTHELESLYDQIRSGKFKINSNIINFTINAIDHIKNLLGENIPEEVLNETENQKSIIRSLSNNDNVDVQKTETVEQNINTSTLTSSNNKVYYINFEPNIDILNDGTNPLYLVDEITGLGETIVTLRHNKLPEFKDVNPESCYMSWTIILSANVDIDEISDVFIFIEDESNIVIEMLSEKNILEAPNATTTFEYLLVNKPDDIDSFKKISATLEEELQTSDVQPIIDEPEIVALQTPENTQEEVVVDTVKEENQTNTVGDTSQKTKTIKKEVVLPSALNIETVKVSAKKLDTLINLVSELITAQARLVTIANNTKSLELVGLSEDFQQLSRQFRDIAFDMRLIPIQTMVVKFKRLVRDLSQSLNKKVKFTTEGTETELDKSIIATLSDPVMHIIRNSIDHGIETPDVRIKNNKPEEGTLHLKAQYSGTSILITIKDDGAGINKEKVISKAISKGLIKKDDKLSDNDIYELLMTPGFSTSDTVSDISGRGVGMDVVRKKINDLRGEISIHSESGKGTKISIRLPLTLSIIDGLLIGINNNNFVVPLSSVKQIYKVTQQEIENAYNNIIDIEGVQFPFINLTKEFEKNGTTGNNLHFIAVGYHGKKVGIIVNELFSEYQAVLKPFSKMVQVNEIFAGATILGDGKVALVIDTNKVIDYYSNMKNN